MLLIAYSRLVRRRTDVNQSSSRSRSGGDSTRAPSRDLVLQMVDEETGEPGYVIRATEPLSSPSLRGERGTGRPRRLRNWCGSRPRSAPELPVRLRIRALRRFYRPPVALVSSAPAGRRAAARHVLHGRALLRRVSADRRLDARRSDRRRGRRAAFAEQSLPGRCSSCLLVSGAAGLAVAVALTVGTPSGARPLARAGVRARGRRAAVQPSSRRAGRWRRSSAGSSIAPAGRGSPVRVGVATISRPGEQRLDLGSDFYDCMQLEDGRIALLMAASRPRARRGSARREPARSLARPGAQRTEHGEVLRCWRPSAGARPRRKARSDGGLRPDRSGQTRLEIAVAGHPPRSWSRAVPPGDGRRARASAQRLRPGPIGRSRPRHSGHRRRSCSSRRAGGGQDSPGSHERLGIEGLVAEIAAACSQPISAADLESLATKIVASAGSPSPMTRRSSL